MHCVRGLRSLTLCNVSSLMVSGRKRRRQFSDGQSNFIGIRNVKHHLYRWAVVAYYDDPYRAPEINPKCLAGYRDQDPRRIRTSPIKEINGKEITTESGSVYILEDMSQEYREWLEANNIDWDPENPIHFKESKS